MADADADDLSGLFYEGKLMWIGPELFVVTKMGTQRDGASLIPVDVEKVEWGW